MSEDTHDHCEQCDEYAAALLDCDRELTRTKKYAETLKCHIKRSSQSTKDEKVKIVALEKLVDQLEFTIRKLRKDPDTMTNQELRSLREHHIGMIGSLEARLMKERKRMEGMQEKVQITNSIIEINKIVSRDLAEVKDSYNQLMIKTQAKALEAAAKPAPDASASPGASGGVCVICLDSMATYAHNLCGCLTYCRMCRTSIQDYKCPICRTRSTGLIKIHNLPW